MERTRIAGIKLNDKKCVIKTKECNFFDMLYTPDGVKPSPNKVRAVENLEPPKNKQELHTFLGMATMKEKVKSLICITTTLTYNDRNEPVALHVDASIKGLGAALFQNNRPIAFASKAFTLTKTRYANIERELLAVVCGCEKFYSYLYGRSLVVKTEHRPLKQILKKEPDASTSTSSKNDVASTTL